MTAANWFIGLELVAPAALSRLGAPPPNVRVMHPSDLQLTVAFMGPVGEQRARAGWRALALDLAPREVQLDHVSATGDHRHELWLVATVRDEELAATANAARDAVSDGAGVPREAYRPFYLRVALARMRYRATMAEQHAAIAWAREADLATASARIDRVALYAWAEDPTEHRYRIVDARTLVRQIP